MYRLFGRQPSVPLERLPHARPMTVDEESAAIGWFTCSTCGRTDLPQAGDWDPPICEECDAAINFDALVEELDDADQD